MALTNCHACGRHVNASASKCMGCGAPTRSTQHSIAALILVALLAACGWLYLGGGWDKLTAKEVTRSAAKVTHAARLHGKPGAAAARSRLSSYQIASSRVMVEFRVPRSQAMSSPALDSLHTFRPMAAVFRKRLDVPVCRIVRIAHPEATARTAHPQACLQPFQEWGSKSTGQYNTPHNGRGTSFRSPLVDNRLAVGHARDRRRDRPCGAAGAAAGSAGEVFGAHFS